jgi:hypothetical protein
MMGSRETNFVEFSAHLLTIDCQGNWTALSTTGLSDPPEVHQNYLIISKSLTFNGMRKMNTRKELHTCDKKPPGLLSSHSRAFVERLKFNAIVQSLAGIVSTPRKARCETNRWHIRVDIRYTQEMRRANRY